METLSIAVMALALLVGGRALLVQIAGFHGATITVLLAIGVALVLAFRRSFSAGGPLARLASARDAAFLAAIGAAIAFVVAPARWSLGATIVGIEIGLAVELLARLVPPAEQPAPPSLKP